MWIQIHFLGNLVDFFKRWSTLWLSSVLYLYAFANIKVHMTPRLEKNNYVDLTKSCLKDELQDLNPLHVTGQQVAQLPHQPYSQSYLPLNLLICSFRNDWCAIWFYYWYMLFVRNWACPHTSSSALLVN